MDGTPVVELRIGTDHFLMKRDSTSGETMYFLNGSVVTVTAYVARIQHYRELHADRVLRPAS
jgi:hypothetical protein